MAKEKIEIFNKWFFMSVVVLSIVLLIILKVDNNEKEYIWEVKYLNDSNEIYFDVVDYKCTDSVEITRVPFNNYIYISTWIDGKERNSKGICLLKRIKATNSKE